MQRHCYATKEEDKDFIYILYIVYYLINFLKSMLAASSRLLCRHGFYDGKDPWKCREAFQPTERAQWINRQSGGTDDHPE